MKKFIDCVAFILVNGAGFLVEKRAKNKSLGPGIIAIPGGHVGEKETIEAAFQREMREELNVTPRKYGFLDKIVSSHPTGNRLVHYFVIEKWEGKLKATEAEKIFWLSFKDYKRLALDIDKKAFKKYLSNQTNLG